MVYRGDGDESRQATVDWSWGTVKYRLGSSDADEDERSELVSSPQLSDVQPPPQSTQLQVSCWTVNAFCGVTMTLLCNVC